jgi:hypothetical protein
LITIATLQTIAISKSPPWPLFNKKNRQITSTSHKILASYATPYMSCVATLATSHTWKKNGWCLAARFVFPAPQKHEKLDSTRSETN